MLFLRKCTADNSFVKSRGSDAYIILVTEDILGLYDAFTPKFVEKFADLQNDIGVAAAAFHKAVVSGTFPQKQHLFWPKK